MCCVFLALFQPLTSIISGIEYIQDAISRVQASPTSAEAVSNSDGPVSPPAPDTAEDPYELVRSCLKSMLGTTSFMTMCINRCLDFTKASKGVKLVPRPETVCLRELVDFPIKILQDVQTQVVITVARIQPNVCTHIITDKQWLLENILCLLSNAVRYSQQGSVDIRIAHNLTEKRPHTIEVESETLLRFEVWDTGIGLTSEAMSALFAPFKQAQRLAGGTGLGLFSLAKRVEALHGSYGVSARPDGTPGSLFWFTIPYRPDVMSATLCETPASGTAYNSPDGSASFLPVTASLHNGRAARSHKEVLVVDDAPSILKMTTMLLTKKGHHVEQATNGTVALEKVIAALGAASAQRYDVVLMDLQMPVMDGAESIRRIRAYERTRRRSAVAAVSDVDNGSRVRPLTPQVRRQLIIALSANSDSDTIQEALEAGADHFMSKPFTYDDFCETMMKSARRTESK
jgi:CheY-like chemotaxis protein